MSKSFVSVVISLGGVCFCSVHSMNDGVTYQISNTKTYIFQCVSGGSINVIKKNDNDEGCPREYLERKKMKYCGLVTEPYKLSIGAITVAKSSNEENSDGIEWSIERDLLGKRSSCSNECRIYDSVPSSERVNVIKCGEKEYQSNNGKTQKKYFLEDDGNLCDVIWSAEASFQKKEDCCSDKYEVFFKVWDEGYNSLSSSLFDGYKEILIKYENDQKDHYEKRGEKWHIKDEPCYLHNYGGGGKPEELYDPDRNSVICTASDVLSRSRQGWEHNGALSVSGLLRELGLCGEKKIYWEDWFSWKGYQVMPKTDDADFCRSFLINSGLITKDYDPNFPRLLLQNTNERR